MSSSRLRWASVALVAAVVAASFAATSLARPTARAATVKTHATAADIAYVKAQIAKAKAIPKFIPPGPAFDAKKAAGKSIFNIPISSAIPFVLTIDQAMQKVAKQIGVKFTEFPTQGQPSQWVQGINQAIAQKVDLIDLQAAPNPYFLQPQLKQAKAAHIPVTVTHLFDIHQPFPPNVTALVPIDFTTAARWEADWAIMKTNGHADVFIIKSAEVVPSNTIVAAIQDELKKHCGTACKSKVVNVPVTDWATKIQSEVQSALTADPNTNYVIPIYDSMSQFAGAGHHGGRQDREGPHRDVQRHAVRDEDAADRATSSTWTSARTWTGSATGTWTRRCGSSRVSSRSRPSTCHSARSPRTTSPRRARRRR